MALPPSPPDAAEPLLDAAVAAELARRALRNIGREYPNQPQYLLRSDGDAQAPRTIHPSFFGCFDWHSSVHTHWLLVRLLETVPDLPPRAAIRTALTGSLTPANARVEADYLREHRAFERPYGLAWLMLLAAETAAARDPLAPHWGAALEPVAAAARDNLMHWLPRLHHPVRSGTHSQTAFAFTLLHDAAALARDAELAQAIERAAHPYFADRDAALHFEPSGEDFLSPCLMEADLLRRLLVPTEFATWLRAFLPQLPEHDDPDWLPCAEVSDETDGRLVHLHGLNLSRAWNLAHIAAALPADDPRRSPLLHAAERHREAGVVATLAAHDYAGDHWLPTFAVYLLTERGRGLFRPLAPRPS